MNRWKIMEETENFVSELPLEKKLSRDKLAGSIRALCYLISQRWIYYDVTSPTEKEFILLPSQYQPPRPSDSFKISIPLVSSASFYQICSWFLKRTNCFPWHVISGTKFSPTPRIFKTELESLFYQDRFVRRERYVGEGTSFPKEVEAGLEKLGRRG